MCELKEEVSEMRSEMVVLAKHLDQCQRTIEMSANESSTGFCSIL